MFIYLKIVVMCVFYDEYRKDYIKDKMCLCVCIYKKKNNKSINIRCYYKVFECRMLCFMKV